MNKRSSVAVGRAVSSFFEPLENRQLLSLVVDLRVPGGAKSANVSSVGQVINMEIWATAKGSNSSGSDEGLQIVDGSLLSTNVSGGAASGTLKATLISPFNALGSTNGQQKDLDGDGDLDVGSNDNTSATNFLFARSATITTNGSVSGSSQSWKIGTATFTVTSLKSTSGQTNLVWRVRDAKQGALWREDGSNIYKNGDTGSYSGGAALVLKRGGTSTGGSISGTVFNDANKNNSKDSSESGIGGVTVFIDKNKNGSKDSGEPSTTTDSGGGYFFGGLASGSYRVKQLSKSGFKITSPSSGYYDLSLSTNQNISAKNFANQSTSTTTVGSIAGNVWVDVNGNGNKDSGDNAKSSVRVYIDKNKNGKFDTGEPTATTNSSGNYKFSNLAAGSYRVSVSQSGYRVSNPSAGYSDITVGSGSNVTSKNFGITQKVLISGRLWVDSDNDGIKDSSESALSGWQVYIDKNKNGKLDAGENVVTTDSSGNYSFKMLSAGSYRVRVVQKTGYTRIAPSLGYYDLNNLGNGSVQKDKNFRYKKP